MLESKDFNELVGARLRDFFQPGERWFRGLWDVGVVLSLREVLEAAEAASHAVLSGATLDWLCADISKIVVSDTGVSGRVREDFKRCLAGSKLKFRDATWFSLRELTAELEELYLLRWADAVAAQEAAGVETLRPERTARAIAGHLLDVGFSQRFLSGWLAQEIRSARTWSLPDLLREFHRLARLPPISYLVLIPVSTGLTVSEAPKDWLDAPAVKKLLVKAGLAHERIRYAGGWLIATQQRDPYSAAQAAFDEVDKRAARLLVGRGQRMSPVGSAFVFGEPTPVSATRASHRVRVGSIERQQQLFAQTATQVDAAFELLAQLDGSSAVAVAAGWAAVEALLVGQSEEKVVAAYRLATLVAASFPRAELTSLAAAQIREKTALGAHLVALGTNRQRAAFIASEITAGRDPAFNAWSDRAALARMKRLLGSPKEQMEDVIGHVHRAFRRYYRQRNMVLHWGKTNPIALRACLRTGTPLLTAGIDRVAHAWFVHGLGPIELATRATGRVTVAAHLSRSLTDFLEDLKP